MTRRIDWRDGAEPKDVEDVQHLQAKMLRARTQLKRWSATRKRIIARCYQAAFRAARAKGRKG